MHHESQDTDHEAAEAYAAAVMRGDLVALSAARRGAESDRGGDPARPLVTGGKTERARRAERAARSRARRAGLSERDRRRFAAILSRYAAGEIDRAAFLSDWTAAGGVVDRIPAQRRRPITRAARIARAARSAARVTESRRAEAGPAGITGGGGAHTSLSPVMRDLVEIAALTAVTAVVPPGVDVLITLDTRSRDALAAGGAVRMWITGGAFVDAGSIPPVVDPRNPSPAWYPSPEGWGGVRIRFAPGGGGRGEPVTALVGSGAAGSLAKRIRAAAPNSIERAVSVSLTDTRTS